MTFFLPTQKDPVARGADRLPTNWEGIGAAAKIMWRDTNVALQRQRQVIGEVDKVAVDAARRLGDAGMARFVDEFNARADAAGLPERRIPSGLSAEEVMAKVGPNGSKRLLEIAREEAAKSPDAWADLDLSDEGVQARVTEQRKVAEERDQETLALSPNPVRNSIVGSLLASVADPVNLAAVPFGMGGGSILRIMFREAMIGAGVEAAQFPARQATAKELDKAEPSFAESVTLGAVGGAILGGAVEGVPALIRGIRYAAAMRAKPKIEGVDPVVAESAVLKAEEAVLNGDDHLEAVREVLRASPVQEPPREPLILTPEMRSVTATTPEPTPLAPDPITTESLTPLPGEAPTTPGETAALAEQALNEAASLRAGSVGAKKTPLLHSLKKAGVRVDPDSPEGQALKSMGITARTMPGLFSRKAKGERTALDTLVAGEWEERFPGLWDATGTPRDTSGVGGDYLDLNGIMEVIRREQAGDFGWMRAIQDANALEKDVARLDRYDPQDAFLSGEKSDTGFFVYADLDSGAPIWDEGVEAAFDNYLARQWPTVKFLPREVDEMKAALREYGGEAEDLVVRALEREIDAAEMPIKEAVKYERPDFFDTDPEFFGIAEDAGLGQPGASRLVGPDQTPVAEGQGAAGAGRGGGMEARIPGSERTDVAEQAARRAKAEADLKAIQSKMRKNGQLRVEDDVNSLFAVKQLDIFDDVTSPEARAFADASVVAMRDMLDLPVTAKADDGADLKSMQQILNEIDEMDALAAEFAKCRRGDE